MTGPVADLVFDPGTVDLDGLLKRLNLANTRRVWTELVARADAEAWPARQLLATLLVEEVAHRQQTRLSREVRTAGFPFLTTIDDFDVSFQKTLKRRLIQGYLSPELVSEGRNVILFGRTGRGKTHLAIAIAYRAIHNGHSARFVTAAHLIDDLSAASRSGRLRDALAPYLHPAVLVIDEVGDLTYGSDAANVLFHAVNERHLKRRPILFTTNKSPFTQWGQVLHDPDLAETIVDRTLERGQLLLLDGPSYRTKHLPAPPLDTASEPATIPGTKRPDFPERAAHPLMLSDRFSMRQPLSFRVDFSVRQQGGRDPVVHRSGYA